MPSDNQYAAATSLFADYHTEDELADARGVVKRTLRAERQRSDGPPWVKIDKRIYYPRADFQEWLRSKTRRPVRSRKAA